jgi:hypothetical protein
LFTHVTVVPTEIVSGSGEYAVVVRMLAPLTIVTVAVVPVGVGVGVGEGDGAVYELPPQAERQSAARRMTPKRTAIFGRLLVLDRKAKAMPADLSDIRAVSHKKAVRGFRELEGLSACVSGGSRRFAAAALAPEALRRGGTPRILSVL